MKATGIVRRIDELGRIVIPKEIRRIMKIREGEPLEIYTDKEGEIILKKYSPIGELTEFAKEYAETLAETCGYKVAITDRDQVVAVAGGFKKEYLGKGISMELEKIIEDRVGVIKAGKRKNVEVVPGYEYAMYSQIVYPIVCDGDVIGAVVLIGKDDDVQMGELEKKLASVAASFLGKQMENN